MRGGGPEGAFAVGKAKGFEMLNLVAGTALEQQEIAVVGQQYLAVMRHVRFDLQRLGDVGKFLTCRLNFDYTPRRNLAEQRLPLIPVLHLVGGKQPAVGHACPGVLELDKATDFGSQRVANGVEEISQGGIAGSLLHGRTGRTRGAEFFQIFFQGIHLTARKTDCLPCATAKPAGVR
jgi:hypothetical protein